ncbi:hypothetical protein N9Y42_00645 [Mariniblastus sp.]|nr:hypothetical protein [Mariniblastus sp.]
MYKTLCVVFLAVASFGFAFQACPSLAQTPVEVGQVAWNRDLAAAETLSSETGKPLFVQFQEVPG